MIPFVKHCHTFLFATLFLEAIDLPGVVKVVIQNIERGSHGYQRIDKSESNPNHEGIVLLPK